MGLTSEIEPELDRKNKKLRLMQSNLELAWEPLSG
jgi:hypothetical protein